MELGLKEKVVVVSGATGAIGQAVCMRFVEEGARLAAFHRGGEGRLDPLRKELEAAGLDAGRVYSVEADLSEPHTLDRGVEDVLNAFGRIDTLVNNAGMTLERPFLGMSDDEVQALLAVNLGGTLHLTRRVLKPMLLARTGSVVTISSLVGSRGGRGVAVYAATKAALNSLTRSLAIEMAPKGIRLNAVAPGVIDTPMSRRLIRRRGPVLLDRIPLSRFGTPDEVASTVLWLASDIASAYITGQVLPVDGGLGL